MSYGKQRADFDIWGRVYRADIFEAGPKLQPNPLAEMIRLYGQRSAEPVKYVQGDPNANTREDIEAAVLAVGRTMASLKEQDQEAHDCLIARHARTFKDTRGIGWKRSQLDERSMARAIFGGNPETAKSKFRRACDRGYALHSRTVAAA